LLFVLIAFCAIDVQVAHAQAYMFFQVTQENLKNYSIAVGNDTVPILTFNMTAAPPRTDYVEAKEPIVFLPGETMPDEAGASPFDHMQLFRVVITSAVHRLPPIGTLLIYREGELVAASHVVGTKLDPASKEVDPSAIDRSTAFEFSISPELVDGAKFEIQSKTDNTIRDSSGQIKIVSFPSANTYWFYVKDFLPKK